MKERHALIPVALKRTINDTNFNKCFFDMVIIRRFVCCPISQPSLNFS
jgi:hypothetical protein